jgi:undecaprenyl-diphosphatase
VAAGDHEPLGIDVWWHDLMVQAADERALVAAQVLAVVGGTIGMIVVAGILILLLLWRRRRWDAATTAIALVAVVAIGATMAAVIGRTRPADSLAERMATSFPSGHTAVATTVAVVWSRTYLHAHWLSDVAAGMLEGVAVALFVWIAVEAVRDRRSARSSARISRESSTEGASTS